MNKFKTALLEYIEERIEANTDTLEEMREMKLQHSSCGAGMAMGGIEELRDLKEFIREYK